ncbi:MAG: phosphotransferase [Candidatus Saccharimonadales bacterium]
MPIEHETSATLDDFDYDKYIIGSSFDGGEGMFDISDNQAENESEEPENAIGKTEQGLSREPFKIYADIETRYDATLYKMGYKTADLGDIKYPELNEWVDFRLKNNRWVKFYPSFVEDQEGNVRFAKTQIRKEKSDVNSLWTEAVILSSELPARDHVKLINFCHGDTKRLTSIVTEAIPLSDGRTANGKEWLPIHAESAARRIKVLEDYDLDNMQEGIKAMPQFERRINATDRLKGMMKIGLEFIDEGTTELINSNIDLSESLKPAFVHGDLGTKNIILKRDGSATFIDWETAATGFIGQDAGKLLSELSDNKTATDAFLKEYLGSGDSFDVNRFEAMKISVLTENLAHINWRINNMTDKKDEKNIAKLVESINPFEKRIRNAIYGLVDYRSKAIDHVKY